ncbi:GTP-binding protein [Niallia sp. Krafla_26]|uniref:GTP-binding protein n=1 Tax=Niallia sp. Krafla_26 TaxID=3064703 RepID=UPI003D169660
MKTSLLLIGGFLGAGKTTLLAELAQRLQEKGEKVAIITNDQGSDLIDTEFMESKGLNATGITGGCFCCKFDDLQETVIRVAQNQQPTWILAEAVGSCTDLVATVIRPMKRLQSNNFRITPITIAVDPERANLLLEDRNPFPYEVGYLFAQQIQEAEIVLLNKSDRVSNELMEEVEKKLHRTNPNARFIRTSAVQGIGLEEWIDYVGHTEESSGESVLNTLDYDIYATAEAYLGWLNASIKLTAEKSFNLEELVKTIGIEMQEEFVKKGFEAAHVKLMGRNGSRVIKGSLTNSNKEWEWIFQDQDIVTEMTLLINARVLAQPNQLSDTITSIVNTVCDQWNVSTQIDHLECFSPARPNPTYRDLVEIN